MPEKTDPSIMSPKLAKADNRSDDMKELFHRKTKPPKRSVGRPKTKPVEEPKSEFYQKQISPEEALALLRNLGYSVSMPSPTEVRNKLEATAEALGIIEHEHKPAVAKIGRPSPITWEIDLTFSHNINGINYGPGRVFISRDLVDRDNIISHLLSQDQHCKNQENRFFESVSRCHLIVKKSDNSGREAAFGHRVSDTFFDGTDMMNAPVYEEVSQRSR